MMTTWKLSTFLKNLGMVLLLLSVAVGWFVLSIVIGHLTMPMFGFLFFMSPAFVLFVLILGED
jgi:hypothetical protein